MPSPDLPKNEQSPELKIGDVVEFGQLPENWVVKRHPATTAAEHYLVKKGDDAYSAIKNAREGWTISKIGKLEIKPDRLVEIVAKL